MVENELGEITRSTTDYNLSDVILLRSMYLSNTASIDKAVEFLEKEIGEKEEEEFAQCWILLGKLYWKQVKTKDALDSFLRVRFTFHEI